MSPEGIGQPPDPADWLIDTLAAGGSPDDAPPTMLLAAAVKNAALSTVANAHAKKP